MKSSNLFSILFVFSTILLSFQFRANPTDSIQTLQNPSNVKIYSFYKQEESKFVFTSYCILHVENTQFKGFFSSSAQSMSEYYFEGEVINGVGVGKVFNLGCMDDCLNPSGTVNVQFNNNNLKITGDVISFFEDVPSYTGLAGFDYGRETELLAEPSISAPQIGVFDENSKAEILEIGNYEKTSEYYNLWYKVRVGDQVGWVFGGLCAFCLGN